MKEHWFHPPHGRIFAMLLWPALMLVADLIIRARIIRTFAALEWTCYMTSVLLMTCLWCLLCRALMHAWRRRRKFTYLLCLALMSLASITIVGVGYAAYSANGDLPDLFLLTFVRCETENAMVMFRDSLDIMHGALLIAAAAALAFWTDRLRKWGHHLAPAGKRSLWVLSLVGAASLWLCWSTTISQGQCFVPLVRIPLIVAMYAQNEVKGINAKPIRLPAREPQSITKKLPQAPVNVLLILNESLRRQNLSLYGYHRDTTPFMKEFAAQHPQQFFAMQRGYSNSTTTLLSVPSILIGIAPVQPLVMRVKAPLPWQWAAAADMHSFYFSSHDLKWLGLGEFITSPPPDKFWDYRMENLKPYRDMGCDDHITMDRALQHLCSLADTATPFLGVIHLNTNHYPYNTEKPYQRWSGSDLDHYDNTIYETDCQVRRIIETLKQSGQLDRTIVIFASDHGEAFKEHGYIAHFYCHFAETISVPLWIWLPESFAKTRDLSALRENCSKNTQNLDILPTILDGIGAWDHADMEEFRAPMMGQSLFRPVDEKRTLFITNTDEIMPSVIGLSSITENFHYMLRTSGSPPLEDLYDIIHDPAERNNLWSRLPEEERRRYRHAFLPFPVSATMMKNAFPQETWPTQE
jgi:glucan phosphoethanolaminetransferase (alkaline phosphatase superfamily)